MLEIVSLGLVSRDLPGTLQLYSEAFGFSNAGATCLWGGMPSKITGLRSDMRNLIWWLVGPRKSFNLELFHFSNPAPQPVPTDWRPSDHGWNRFGLIVADFDACMVALRDNGVEPLAAPIVKAGRRRLAIRDPYIGVIVEVMECDPQKPEGPIVSYVTSSVSDLESARRLFRDVLELELLPLEQLHVPSDEALWELPGAERDGFLARMGDVLMEIVHYRKPAGRPKPANYQVCDQGFMNVAIVSRDVEPGVRMIERVKAAGYVPPYVFNDGRIVVCYINDPEHAFEFGVVPEELRDAAHGFARAPFDFMRGGVGLRQQAE